VETTRPWDRIESWLSRHAPSYRAILNGPASTAELAAVESAIGVELPAELRAWWLTANGVRPSGSRVRGKLIPEYYQPRTAKDALDTRDLLLTIQREVYPTELHAELDAFIIEQTTRQPGTVPPHSGLIWLPPWLPLAEDGMGGGLFVDLRRGPGQGCVMAYAKDGATTGPRWPDVSAMWTQIADALDAVDHEEFERTNEFTIGRWHLPYH
jgi:cell wall assembly regulator SMI1